MKRNIWKRFICLSMSAVMLIGVSFADKNEVAAEELYDASVTITVPKPEGTPQQPTISGSSMKYEMLGYVWEDYCNLCENEGAYYSSDTEFMNWYTDIGISMGNVLSNKHLKKFENGHEYSLIVFAKVSNFSSPVGVNGDVICIDSASSENIGMGNCDLMPVSAIVSESPDGISLPSCLTENDTLVIINDIPDMKCAPEGHEHTPGEYYFDDEYHWRICSECGIDLYYTKSEHSVSHLGTEPWTVTKSPTETEEGLWEKKCSNKCGYKYDSVVVPCLDEQTIVSSYDELRDALARGGKQWITISCPGNVKWIVQEDMTAGNTLKVDDPNADITIDMNGCRISRETGKYEKALFEIQSGKLRILSRSYGTPTNAQNLSFKSFSPDYTLFRVYENGSLRITNVNGALTNSEVSCANPSVISEGNLQIDGGIYNNDIKKFDPESNNLATCILIKSGKTVINGGEFTASSCAVASLGGKLTINNGKFGAWDEAVYIKNVATITDIYGGTFDRNNTNYNWGQDYGVYINKGSLNIYGGDFYGELSGVFSSRSAKSVNIYDGYFKLRGSGSSECDGAFSFDPASCKVTIYNGIFSGSKGITFYDYVYDSSCSYVLTDYLFNGGRKHTVTDDGIAVDISKTAEYYGSSYLNISCKTPYFFKQPESVTAYTGDEIVFMAKAGNAVRYEWFVVDVDSGKPYSWDDLKQYHDISTNGENSDTLVIKNINGWFDGKGVICDAYNDNGWDSSDVASLNINVRGDVNLDGKFDVADIVTFQKWLLDDSNVKLVNWKTADFCEDDKLNVIDLCIMKQKLISE